MVKPALSAAWTLLLLLLVSCGSDGTGPDPSDSVPASVSVSPGSVTLDALGATIQLSAVVRNQNGQTISNAPVAWSTTDPSVVSINASSGLVTALSVGQAFISATSGAVSGNAAATVRQVPTQVHLSLAKDQISVGSATQATLSVLDAGGNAIPSADIVWGTGNPGIATVSNQGGVTAVSPGFVRIKASVGSLADSTGLSVSVRLEGDQLSTQTGINGETAVFTSLEGGTHFQLSVKNGAGQPLAGATVQFAEVGDKALFTIRGAGNGYAPAFLFSTVAGLVAYGEPWSAPELSGSGYLGGGWGPEAAVSQAVRLGITLPAVSAAGLEVIEGALQIPTFLYDPAPVAFGTDGPFRGRKCMTWAQLAQHQRDRLQTFSGWSDAVTTLFRSSSPSFFDPVPLAADADVFFSAPAVLPTLTGEDLLAEKINLLGAMLHESLDDRRVEVTWDFGDGGPEIRRRLGWYGVQTNDRYCGGAVPETLAPLQAALVGAPGAPVQGSVKVRSVWGNEVPGVAVHFSLASNQGVLEGGGLEVTKTTDESGVATVPWTLPSVDGTYLLSATVAREGAQNLTASISGEARTSTLVVTSFSLAAGTTQTCGLTPYDGAFCWGRNAWGELGIGVRGVEEYRSGPALVLNSKEWGFKALSTGEEFTCALGGDGKPYCWGRNDQGQLGSGTLLDVRSTPTPVEGGFQFTQLVSGLSHSCGLTEGGTAFCWGDNDQGQLGNGTLTDRIQPGPVSGGIQFQSLTAGQSHTCGIANSGIVYCWGGNDYGALGDGTLISHLTPTAVSATGFTSLSAGWHHTCGLRPTGQVYCWGQNTYGQLGIGNKTDTALPTLVTGGVTFASVDAGGLHTCGVTADGVPLCWGRNHIGQVGDGSLSDRTAPVEVSGQLSFELLKAGPFHTCGLQLDGKAYCWGDNSGWQLGQGAATLLYKNTPLDVKTDLRFGRPTSTSGG